MKKMLNLKANIVVAGQTNVKSYKVVRYCQL